MKVFKCSVEGMELVENTFDKLPIVIIKKEEINVYAKSEVEAKELYVRSTNKEIIRYLNKITKMQQSINSLK